MPKRVVWEVVAGWETHDRFKDAPFNHPDDWERGFDDRDPAPGMRRLSSEGMEVTNCISRVDDEDGGSIFCVANNDGRTLVMYKPPLPKKA